MKKCVLLLLAVTTVLLAGTGFKFNEAVAADQDTVVQCMSNCFWGYVYIQNLNGSYHPGQGNTVYLYYCLPVYPPSETLIGTRQTDGQGKYCFCKGLGQWDSGNYRIISGGWCRQDTVVYRGGDGEIQADFHHPNPCTVHSGPRPQTHQEPAQQEPPGNPQP